MQSPTNGTQVSPLRITDVTLRDGHQSLLATRMRTEDMLPVAEQLDNAGFWSMEVWGGATFDTCLRFLNEDPWERLRQLKSVIKKTPLQMLLRGQNVVGYRNYADDVLERFVVKARENGMDIFRIFDALNDVRNMEVAMRVAKREGGHVQAAVCYTISPVHTIDAFVEMGKRLAAMGADSICIKDMAGLISPPAAFELVSKLKAALPLPVQLHSHSTSGMATAACIRAADAGVDGVDAAVSTMSMSTSLPPAETLIASLEGTPRETGIDIRKLGPVATYFGEVRKKYHAFESNFVGVDTNVLAFQIPGGMFSNLASQLREQGAGDKMAQVLEEVPRVRAELGYPPLVTPSSQFVGTQATLNVLVGERYKMIPKEIKAYVMGLYGKPPGPVDPEVQRLAIGDEPVIDCRPADLLAPELGKAEAEIASLAHGEEDVISYALFGKVARDFFEKRASGDLLEKEVVAAIAAALAPAARPQEAAFVQATDGDDGASWVADRRSWERGAWRNA
jgi:pyruvate carboxylase subunit B